MPMMSQNPFIQRGLPLSELIANARAIQFEGNSPFTNLLNRNKLGQINQAIDMFGRRMPMQQPMRPPMPRPMPQPIQRPMPQPMRPQPMPVAPGVMGPAPGGTNPTVTVTGGGWGAQPPAMQPPAAQPMSWNALGLGGMIPGMGGQRGVGYGGYGGFGSFGGFSAAQPYRPMPGGSGIFRDPREMTPYGFRGGWAGAGLQG